MSKVRKPIYCHPDETQTQVAYTVGCEGFFSRPARKSNENEQTQFTNAMLWTWIRRKLIYG